MVDEDRAELLSRLAEEIGGESTHVATGEAVVSRAVSYVDDADSVSITVHAGRGYLTLAASDAAARRLDELQYDLEEGPCVNAATDQEWFRSGDVEHDTRWPRWAPRAHELGARSLLSVRLLSAGRSIGALNFYSSTGGAFAERDEVDFAVLYAAHVAIALASSRQVADLETAVTSRHLIGVAQGVLIERYGLDEAQSFSLLRRYSNTTNTKLSAVADEIVRTGRLPYVDDPRTGGPDGR